jgi:hypothetical protein
MAQKLNGRLSLSKIPKELIQTSQNGDKFIYVDIVPNRNGADQYGNTHSISVYDKQNRKPIYLGNLKPQEFGGQGGNGGGHSNGSDDLPW